MGRVAAQARNNSWVVRIVLGSFLVLVVTQFERASKARLKMARERIRANYLTHSHFLHQGIIYSEDLKATAFLPY